MRVLFFIAGVGAGNTTRTMAVLQEMQRQSPEVDIHLAAQGKALELLARSHRVHPMRSVTYTEKRKLTAWNIVSSNLAFPLRFLQNRSASADLMKRLRPDVVVADSDFYCLSVARSLRIPLVSINNSAAIIAQMKQTGVPAQCRFSARFIERTDHWLQSRYPDRVICPVLRRTEGLADKFCQIPPIVRSGFETSSSSEHSDEVVVITGGSGIGTADIDLRNVQNPIVTYGAHLEKVPPHARQLGFTLDDVEPMRRARVLMVQGGFSSVSEAAALHRPTVVVPIARHAEQHVNARIFEELGLGLAASGPLAGDRVNQILSQYDSFNNPDRWKKLSFNGAEHAARLILEMDGHRTGNT